MKKIVVIALLIVSLILPQTVKADEPYNAWDSCSKNFVKYSNQGEYCIIVEVENSTRGIQYILCHDIANRNPLIYQNGVRRFLNLFDTSRYEVYYSDYVQSMTGLSSIFEGNKLELGNVHPSTGFRAEIVRSNYGLYNIDDNLIYDANYYSEVTEIVGEPDWLTDNALTGNENYLAVFQILDDSRPLYGHYVGLSLAPWLSWFDGTRKIYVPSLPESNIFKNCFIYNEPNVPWYICDLGTTLEASDLTNVPNWDYYSGLPGYGSTFAGSTRYYYIRLENSVINNDDMKSYNKLVLFNWTYGENIAYTGSAGATPTPIIRPTVAPLASPTPIPDGDAGIFGLGNTIRRIFLPSPDILYNEVNASKDLLLDKLHIDLDAFSPENGGRPNNVTMTLYGHNVTLLDFEQIEDLASQARTPINIVRVFVYIFALWGLVKYIIDYFNNRGGGNNA